jgi:hypothetical protein
MRNPVLWVSAVLLLTGAVFYLATGTEATQAQQRPLAVEIPPIDCKFVKEPIVIDGKLDDAAWQKANLITDFVIFWQAKMPRMATAARLIWNDEGFFFYGEMHDEDLYADVTEHNGMCWLNDVFELFFKPEEKNRAYYEFQVNAAGTHLEMYLPSRGAGGYGRFGKKDVKLGMGSVVKLDGTLNKWQDKDGGWIVEGKIPWTAFAPTGGKPKAGDVWRFSLCRYDYAVNHERPELSSTSLLTQPDFHRYEDYRKLKFVAE